MVRGFGIFMFETSEREIQNFTFCTVRKIILSVLVTFRY